MWHSPIFCALLLYFLLEGIPPFIVRCCIVLILRGDSVEAMDVVVVVEGVVMFRFSLPRPAPPSPGVLSRFHPVPHRLPSNRDVFPGSSDIHRVVCAPFVNTCIISTLVVGSCINAAFSSK